MKTIKRNFLEVEEILRFNTVNNHKIVRHYNAKHFNSFIDDKFNLRFDHSYGKTIESVGITAIYLDYSKSIKAYEHIESLERFTIVFQFKPIDKSNENFVQIKTKEGTRILWKLIFEIREKEERNIHISIN